MLLSELQQNFRALGVDQCRVTWDGASEMWIVAVEARDLEPVFIAAGLIGEALTRCLNAVSLLRYPAQAVAQ